MARDARDRSGDEEAQPPDTGVPPPPAPVVDALQRRWPRGKCSSQGCPYRMHESWEQRDWGPHCCGHCRDRALMSLVPGGRASAHGPAHGPRCERQLLRESDLGRCSTRGCNFRPHSNPEKIAEFGQFCCSVCRYTRGQRCGPQCEMLRVPWELLDLARGRPAEASSSKQSLPAHAVDGSPGSHWSSEEGSARPHWLEVDLGDNSHHISHVVVIWEATYAKHYSVEGARARGKWQTLASALGHEGMVVTLLDSGCWRWLRIFTWQPATRFGVSIRELKVYAEERCDEQASQLQALCARDLLGFLDSLEQLSMASCQLLGHVHEFQRAGPAAGEERPPRAAEFPEYESAREALGVEPSLLAQSRLHRSLQGIKDEFRRVAARRGRLPDPSYAEEVLERAIRKAYNLRGGEWRHIVIGLGNGGGGGAQVKGGAGEDALDCNVYQAVRRLCFEGWALPAEPFPSDFAAFALETICQREPPEIVRAVLEDLCHCAQLAASPVEQVLSLGHCLLERALPGPAAPAAPARRSFSDLLDTWEGAMQKFQECMDQYMDEHKEKAFVSAFVAPAEYYLDQVKEDPMAAETWLRYGQNFYRALLHSSLGIRMPWPASSRQAAIGPQVLDLWNGLSVEAQKVFKREEYFGSKPPAKEFEALGSGHILKFSPPGLFSNRRPAEQAKALGSRERKRMSKYLEHFAHFFQAKFFARLALQALEREVRPEYCGGRRAMETLYAKYRLEDLTPGAEASVWDHLYPEGREKGMDEERAQNFLLSFKSFEILRPPCPGRDTGKRLLYEKSAVLTIQRWWSSVRRRLRCPLSGEQCSETASSGPSSGLSKETCCSAPPAGRTRACFLPGTRVFAAGGRPLGLEELVQGSMLESGQERKAEVRKILHYSSQDRDLYEVVYGPRGLESGGQGATSSGGWEEVLVVTRGQLLSARGVGEPAFRERRVSELRPGHRLRGPTGEEFEIRCCVPRLKRTGCLEVFLQDPRSTFFAAGQGTPKERLVPREHFVEVYGEQELEPMDCVLLLTYRNSDDFEEVLLKSDRLRGCRSQLRDAGFDSDLGTDFRSAKMFVERHLAGKVMELLPRLKHQLCKRSVIVSWGFYWIVSKEVEKHNRAIAKKEVECHNKATRRRNYRKNYIRFKQVLLGSPGHRTWLTPPGKLMLHRKEKRDDPEQRVVVKLTFLELTPRYDEHTSVAQSDIREYIGLAATSRSECKRKASYITDS